MAEVQISTRQERNCKQRKLMSMKKENGKSPTKDQRGVVRLFHNLRNAVFWKTGETPPWGLNRFWDRRRRRSFPPGWITLQVEWRNTFSRMEPVSTGWPLTQHCCGTNLSSGMYHGMDSAWYGKPVQRFYEEEKNLKNLHLLPAKTPLKSPPWNKVNWTIYLTSPNFYHPLRVADKFCRTNAHRTSLQL